MYDFTSLAGSATAIDPGTISQFRASIKGNTLGPDDTGYDETRTIWNAMIDRRPGLIVQCESTEDVQKCVTFAARHGLMTSIRGAGHNIAGSAICDGGLMIDLSGMNSVTVDAEKKVAQVGPGATLGDVDAATLKHALAVPTGINSTTGIAGLTLGGGFGWFSRKHGMTCDCLRSADVVTADGKLVHADGHENADLFWAVRGGGGNFGVVVNFEFDLFDLGPDVLAGLIVFPLSEAVSILKRYRQFADTLTEDTSVWVVLRKAPPLPFLPEDVHGSEVIVLALCHIGDVGEGQKAIEPIRGFGTILGEHVGVMPFVDWQQAFDPLLTPGARNYWKSHNFTELSDGAIESAVKYAGILPSPECEIFLAQLGGAASRPAPDATAWSHRDAQYVLNVHSRWQTADQDEACVGWARDFFQDTRPYATGGVYVNFMTEDETDRVRAAYGSGFERLQTIKRRYDSGNLFRANHNITPTG